MIRVRVIRNGKVIGSLPSSNGKGYSGATSAHYMCLDGTDISMGYETYWVDDQWDPIEAMRISCLQSPPSFRTETFLDARAPVDPARIEGWESVEKTVDAYTALKGMIR